MIGNFETNSAVMQSEIIYALRQKRKNFGPDGHLRFLLILLCIFQEVIAFYFFLTSFSSLHNISKIKTVAPFSFLLISLQSSLIVVQSMLGKYL